MTIHPIHEEVRQRLMGGQASQALALMREWLEQNPGDEIALSMLGSALMKLGRLDEALEVFRRAAGMHPGSFASQGDLGFAHMTAGNAGEAIACFEKAVSINGNFYQGWCCLGKLRFGRGDLGGARQAFDRADALDPFVTEARQIQRWLDESRFASAEKEARKILSRQAGHPKASLALARIASSVGAFEEAAEILAAAIGNFPCDLALRAARISSLEEVGDYTDALAEAHAAAAMEPENWQRWLAVGRIQGACGRYEEALAAYDRALGGDFRGDDVVAGHLHLLRGHVLRILGHHEQSVSAYRTSAAKARENGAAWWGLADLKTHRFSDEDVEEIRRLADDASLKPAQRSQAAFALGKALEDRGDHAEAFRAYERANAMRPNIAFDPKAFADSIDELISVFTPDLLAHRADPPPSGPVPIFIVGLPRSGSTLIEQILASHSAIEGTMELPNLPHLQRRIRIDGGRRKADYPASLAGFDAAELSAYGQRYLDGTALYRSGKACFIDKLPTNFERVGLIHMILPGAVIIDATRDPLDGGFSCFRQHFAGGHEFSYDLANIGHYYNGYRRLMTHWDRVLPGKVLRVRHEDLVHRTEDVVRQMLSHCGLPFEDACLSFFASTRPVRTPSSEQVRQPIYNTGIGHWRKLEKQLEPLSRVLDREEE